MGKLNKHPHFLSQTVCQPTKLRYKTSSGFVSLMIHSHFRSFDSSQALSMLFCSLLLFVLVIPRWPLRCHRLLDTMNKLFSALCPVSFLTIELHNLRHGIVPSLKRILTSLIQSLISTCLLSFQNIIYMELSLHTPCKTNLHNFCAYDKS